MSPENQKILDKQYSFFLKENKLPSFTKKQIQQLDNSLKSEIIDELISNQGEVKKRERMLKHKWAEVNKKLKSYSPEFLEELRQKVWIPNDKSDYRRIIPEMVLISDRIRIKRKDIFGNETHDTHEHQSELAKHWTIMAICTSKARADNVPGRQLKYLVRDKITKKYLGFIAITGTLPNLKPRNVDVFKTNNIKQYFQSNSVIALNMANGQKIVASQPFGTLFNGGKLLSLLCCSNVVARDWQKKYGDVLITVDTTSLYGGKVTKGNETQYDGLRPYWWYLGDTEGKDTPYKPEEKTYAKMNNWLFIRDTKEWFKIQKAKTAENMNMVREPKNTLIKKVFTQLEIKKALKELNKDRDEKITTSNQEQRGVYLSKLYKNGDEFLRGEITQDKLIPAFNNSISFLTELWKYGFEGDTKSYVNPEIVEMENQLKSQLQEMKQQGLIKDARIHERRSSAKKRLRSNLFNNLKRLTDDMTILQKIEGNPQKSEYYSRKLKLQSNIHNRLNTEYTWYGFMLGKSWAEVKEIYAHEL